MRSVTGVVAKSHFHSPAGQETLLFTVNKMMVDGLGCPDISDASGKSTYIIICLLFEVYEVSDQQGLLYNW